MRKLGWALMTILSLIIAVYAISVVSVPAMRPPFLTERFRVVPLAAFFHLAASAVALAVGPFQHNTRIRARCLTVHRWSGRAYVIAVLLGGSAALVLATTSQAGLTTHLGFGALAVLWLYTTAMAYRRILAKDLAAHRRWMTRSFALTLAAVTLRIYMPASLALGIPFDTAYRVVSWMCWVPNLIIAEWLIRRRRRKVPVVESRAAAAA